MERRSGRVLRSLPPKSMAEDESDVETADNPQPESSTAVVKKPARPTKRTKTAAHPTVAGMPAQFKKTRGKRGLLKDVVDMPMDVLYEIFSQLDPMDLLNLARTTKDLRAILMSRASIFVWKQAFTNVSPPGLPECPSDLNEPQYAELAFGKPCTFCDRKLAIIHVVWQARVRACNKCLEAKFLPVGGVYYEPYALRDSIPGLEARASGRRRKYRFLVYDTIGRQWRQEYSELKETEKANWIKKKVAEQDIVRRHARLCEAWAETRQNQFEDEKAMIVEERKAIVMDYIRELGWGEELDKIPIGVSKPAEDATIIKFCQKDITQRGLEGMTDYLSEYMEGVQTKRIFREQKEVLQTKLVTLKETYTSYLLTLPPTEFYPNTAEIYGDQNVKQILKGTKEFSPEQLDILKAMFPELLQTWREPINRNLIQLVTATAASEKYAFDPSSVLDLVTTAFICSQCICHIQAKQAITHRCTREASYIYGRMPDEEEDLLKSTIKEIRWNALNCLAFAPVTSKQVAGALESCGFDPTVTTVEQLEKNDPIFECLGCHNVTSGRCMIRWQGLYSHANNHYKSMKLIVVSEEDATIARARMKEETEKYHAREQRSTMCIRCRMTGCLLAMLDHVKTTHEVAKPKPGEDVIISPGAGPEPHIYRFWPPRLREDVLEMIGE